MKEEGLERKLKKKVEAAGGLFLKWVSPGFSGVPDRICLMPGGRIVFLEIKRPGRTGGLSPRQIRVIGQIRGLGFQVAVVNSEEAADEYIRSS